MIDDKEIKVVLSELVKMLLKDYKPQKIILYGSYAEQNSSEDSDLDLLIIKNTESSPLERWMEVKKILREISKRYPVSPLVYTEKEIEARLAIKDYFINDILEKGQVLYG